MATVAQNLPESSGPSVWFREFLKEELAPHPGRAALVARMVICATLVMLITMTFRLPYGMHGAIFTLIISRESVRATLKHVRTTVIAFAFSAIFIFIGALFSLDDPTLRLLWIIGTLFVVFFVISAMTNYVAATGFGILIAITISLWDMHVPVEFKAENTLWAFAQTAMACAITLLVELVFSAFQRGGNLRRSLAEPKSDNSPVRLFARDALSNSDHIKFGLRGCLAASLCYIIYTSLAWPGISTAVVTCILTALTTVGSSRQKQVLRVSGAIVGGVIVGIGAQVFILPYLDSIAGFTLLFIAVTVVAAWFATSSPRLSYFGVQFALAFFVINLQEFKMQTSLTVARDRVIGILLGLFMMWLVFDQLWSASAVEEMKKSFVTSLRLLGQLFSVPQEQTSSLREQINTNLNKLKVLGDGVLFEFGSSRQQDLALRGQIMRWQSQVRMLSLMEIPWLKYRLQLPGFELPEALREAQMEFDDELARTLESMADRFEGIGSTRKAEFENAFERLERKIQSCYSRDSSQQAAAQLQTFQNLCLKIGNLTLSMSDML
jgi:Fusaric acid resistance protein family